MRVGGWGRDRWDGAGGGGARYVGGAGRARGCMQSRARPFRGRCIGMWPATSFAHTHTHTMLMYTYTHATIHIHVASHVPSSLVYPLLTLAHRDALVSDRALGLLAQLPPSFLARVLAEERPCGGGGGGGGGSGVDFGDTNVAGGSGGGGGSRAKSQQQRGAQAVRSGGGAAGGAATAATAATATMLAPPPPDGCAAVVAHCLEGLAEAGGSSSEKSKGCWRLLKGLVENAATTAAAASVAGTVRTPGAAEAGAVAWNPAVAGPAAMHPLALLLLPSGGRLSLLEEQAEREAAAAAAAGNAASASRAVAAAAATAATATDAAATAVGAVGGGRTTAAAAAAEDLLHAVRRAAVAVRDLAAGAD